MQSDVSVGATLPDIATPTLTHACSSLQSPQAGSYATVECHHFEHPSVSFYVAKYCTLTNAYHKNYLARKSVFFLDSKNKGGLQLSEPMWFLCHCMCAVTGTGHVVSKYPIMP